MQPAQKMFFSLSLLFSLCFLTEEILAATFKVNSGYDVNDLTPGNGLCVAYLIVNPPFVIPFCTLRGAIEETNNLPGHDVIELPSGTFSLSLEGGGENNASTGDLDITDSLEIVGKGAQFSTIDGKSIDRIFDIVGPDITVTIKNMSILNGKVVSDALATHRGGGAIHNDGNLILRNVVLLNHEVIGSKLDDAGGILFNSGTCQIITTTLQGGSALQGGAIYNTAAGEISILSSTISNNVAIDGAGVSNAGYLKLTNSTMSENGDLSTHYGGAMKNDGTLVLQHVTVATNSAVLGGGIGNKRYVYSQNSIIAENNGEDCYLQRSMNSLGYNLDSDGSCGFLKTSDLTGVPSGLKPLRNNGGTTQTHDLYPWSPAFESGLMLEGVKYDQRGVLRPKGAGVERGAVETLRLVIPPLVHPLLTH